MTLASGIVSGLGLNVARYEGNIFCRNCISSSAEVLAKKLRLTSGGAYPSRPPLVPLTYCVTLKASSGGFVQGSGTYPLGSLVTCSAVAAQGYVFYLKFEAGDGKMYAYCFMHLEVGNAVGFNVRKQRNFEKGDKVYRGEIIAYTGRSGNAYNVVNPHLHLSVYDYSLKKFVDPEPFVNGKITKTKNGKIDSKTLAKVKCDEENSND